MVQHFNFENSNFHSFSANSLLLCLGRVILAGDNLMLEIPESTQTDYLDIIRNDKLEFVQLVGTASCRKSISATDPLTTLGKQFFW